MSSRDRFALFALAGFLILLLFVYGIVIPIQNTKSQRHQAIATAKGLVNWLEKASSRANAYRQTTHTSPKPSRDAFVGLIETSLRDSGLREGVETLSLDNNQILTLTLVDVPFDNAIMWLSTHVRDNNIQIQHFKASKSRFELHLKN